MCVIYDIYAEFKYSNKYSLNIIIYMEPFYLYGGYTLKSNASQRLAIPFFTCIGFNVLGGIYTAFYGIL